MGSRRAPGPAMRRCSTSSTRCATRIITAPCFGSGKVIGAILFERTMDGTVDGKPTPQALIDMGVVPFIKIDKGLEAEDNGVQMMKPMPGLDALLERPSRSACSAPRSGRSSMPRTCRGLRSLVAPAIPGRAAGDRARPDADHRARGEHQERRPRAKRRSLLTAILEELDELPDGQRVMLKLSIPAAGLVRRRWSITPRCFASSRCPAGSAARKPAASSPKIPA